MSVVVFGSLNMDLMARLPQPGETLSSPGFAATPGGKGANQAVAAARLGSKVRMVGNDAFGATLRAGLEADGVDASGVGVSPGAATGVALLGAGGMLGGLAITPLSRRYRQGQLYPALPAFGMSGLLIMTVMRAWWAPGLGFGMVSACNVAWVVLPTSVRQELIPSEMMGRVPAFSRIMSTAAMPLGAVLAGFLSGLTSPTLVFALAAATKAGEILIARYSSMRAL